MRLDITLPDQLYSETQRAAIAAGVSKEETGPVATPELIASLHAAQAEIDAGQGLTIEEVRVEQSAKRDEYIGRDHKTTRQAPSSLACEGVEAVSEDSAAFMGFRPLPKRGTVITSTLINQLREELGD